MADTPNSHKDQFWSDLSSDTEKRLGLPSGLLASVVTRGERSNNDQVSEAGAKTVFQIIPSTRKAALEKYGIDAYLSPQNAADVAGLLLKDSLDRNNGDVKQAVAEYHGGTNRDNWGPKTKAYVARVVAGVAPPDAATEAAPGQSTFQKSLAASQPPENPNGIANIFKAYQSGQMSTEERADFEADVNAGKLMLPRGATLGGQAPKSASGSPAPTILPSSVTDAYQTGQMNEQERAELEADLKAGLVQLAPSPTELPDFQNGQIQPSRTGILTQQADPSLGQQIVGAGETALAMGTGATGGTLGQIGGTLKGLAEQLLSGQFGTQQAADAVENSAMGGAAALTYAPRTQAGQQMTQAVGEVAAPLAAVAPLAGELSALGASARAAAPIVRAAAPIVQEAASGVTAPVRAVMQKAAAAMAPAAKEAGAAPSAGAAGVEQGTLRQAKASELPVPIQLTEGQKSRDFGQQRFERETAKDPEIGAPIRERFADQNAQLQQNLDQFIDNTGGQAPDLRSLGESVTKSIGLREQRHKDRIRGLYKQAEEKGELEQKVTLPDVINHINQSGPEAANASILEVARRKAIQTGAAVEGPDGMLKANPVSLKNAEEFRKTLVGAAGADPVNIRQASIMKGLIDQSTEGVGGQAYRKARAARARYAKDYENIGLIDNLIGTKRGTSDRSIAMEDVLRKSVIDPSTSLDTVKQLRRVLNTQGQDGRQSWRDIQGATLQHIKDEATKNVARDERGNPIVSAAALDRIVKNLDKNDKLDFIFGKKGAEQIRTINDVAKDILVAPPGTVNFSNTGSVLAGLLDVGLTGVTGGIPAPVATTYRLISKGIKDKKTRARVQKALGLTQKEEQ